MLTCKVMRIWLRTFDIIIILFVAVLTFFSAYSVYLKPQGKSDVLIRGQSGEWIYPVETEETVIVPGPIGETIVRIHGNRAWIESSPCDNQNCVVTGQIARQGQWAACLPNSVLLMIHGTEDIEGNDVDAIVW